MSIELKQAAEKALVVLGSATSFMSRKARDQHESVVAELRTAIQQAEAQQPAAPEPLADHSDHVADIAARLRLVANLAGCPDAVPDDDGVAVGCIFAVLGNMRRALEKKLATGEPTPQDVVDAFEKARAGSDKPVGILRGVRAVMRLLPDLKPAPDPIAPATPEPVKVVPYNPTTEMMFSMKGLDPALSLSQCRELWSVAWKAAPTNHPAPSAAVTPEPVVVQHRKPVIGWKGETIGYTGWRDGKGLDGWPHRDLYDHPAPSVPDAAIDSAIYNQCPDFDDWHEGPSIDDIRAIVRAAMLAAKEGGAA